MKEEDKVDYDVMPAGPEMDVLVAMEVMGWDGSARVIFRRTDTAIKYDAFKPSTDIVAAWAVMEKMATYRDVPYPGADADNAAHHDYSTWRDYSTWPVFESQFYRQVLLTMTAQEVALHICRAALKARLG